MPNPQRDDRQEALSSHHRQMLETLPCPALIAVDDVILSGNAAALALFGKEMEPRPLVARCHEAERDCLTQLLADAHRGERPPAALLTLDLAQGPRRCEVRIAPLAVEARPGALVLIDDRSEPLAQAERLASALDRYRSMFDQALYAQCVLDLADGHVREANPAFRTLVGVSPAQVTSLHLGGLYLPGPDGGSPPDQLLALLRRGERAGPTELRIRRVDGSETWVEASMEAITDADGERRTARAFLAGIDKRKQTEAALVASEQRFRDFAESSSDWFWEIGPDYRFTFASGPKQSAERDRQFYRTLVGRTRWEAVLADPQDEPWRSHIADLDARRPFRNFRYTMPLPGQRSAHFLINGIPVFKPDGTFAGYRGTATNETERVEAAHTLRRTRKELTDALARVPMGIALFDTDDRLIARNNIERDFGPVAHLIRPGLVFEEMLRLSISAGLLPEAAGREDEFIRERLERHRQPGPPFLQRHGDRWIEVREHRLENGHTVMLEIDITESRRVEKALRDSEIKFRSLIEGSVQAVVIHREGRPLFVNRAFVEMFGFDTPEQVLHLGTIFGLFVPENRDRVRKVHRERVRGSGELPTEYQHEMLRRDGSRFWIESRLSMVDWDGAPAVQATVVDITERRNVERMKNDFISTVSHELRTPLTSIAGSLGLIAGGMAGPISEKAQRLIDIAASNSDRLVRLINSILDIEKIESGRLEIAFERLSPAQIVRQAVEVNRGFADEYGIDLVIEKAGPAGWIEGGSDQLIQVLTNLLSNAIKFSPPRGEVRLAVRRRGEMIRFSVHDRGPGIPEEFRSRVFDKFTQADSGSNRRHTGTGLGLSICRALVERHNGTIGFETELGVGTEFYFDLPEVRLNVPRNRRILIVEDEPDVATLISLLLEQEDLEPEVVHRADDAWALLQRHDYAAATIDLLLPDGSGVELLRNIRGNPAIRDLPVIVLSATAQATAAGMAEEHQGRTVWLNKPIDRHRLADTLNAFLGDAAAGRGAQPDEAAP